MSTRDDAADAALVAEHGGWLADASRKDIKTRLGVGSGRATRLRELARASQGRAANPVSESRITQSGYGPAHSGQEDSLPDSGNHFSRPHILVVGDAHFEPDNSIDRARWLGRFISDNLGPDDHVVCIGDWHGMTALCSHNSPAEAEGRRVKDDIDAGNDAIDAMMAETVPDCRPRFHVTLGNHEDPRLERLAQERPEWAGMVGVHQLGWYNYDVNVVRYLQPLRIAGWRFQHCVMNAGGKRPVSGVNVARNLLKRFANSESIVCGHNHKLRREEVSSELGGRKWGYTVGCYFDHHEHYARDSNFEWWAGLCLIEHAHDGDGGFREIPFRHIKAMYAERGES